MKNYGLILEPQKPEDYVFGDQKLGDAPINPSGDWTSYLPVQTETQDEGGFEPYCCVSEATTHAVETLLRQEYGATNDLSVRFLAKLSNTDVNHGASLQGVANNLKNSGDVDETDYPFKCSTFQEFYQALPKWLIVKAQEFCAQYSFGYSIVPSNADAIKLALTYSPLIFTVYAWMIDENGLYYRPSGEQDCHAVMCYGYEDGQYFKIYDSYSKDGSVIKKVRWDSIPQAALRITLHRQIPSDPTSQAWWVVFQSWLSNVYNKLRYGSFGGVARSPRWSQVRDDYLKKNPICAITGIKTNLNVHHKKPFHLYPELELDENNLITLTTKWGAFNMHLLFGHLGNFKSFNDDIDVDAKVWNGKIRTRPL